MGRLFRRIPPMIRTAIGVLLVGGMVGYTLAATASTVISDQGWFATSGEPVQSRNYMIAVLQREADRVNQMRPAQDVVSQALAEQAAQQSRQASRPVSLTYLGGASHGPYSVQIYAIELRANDGRNQLFPIALTLVGGRVVATR